jgi:hypothetical protein
MERLGKRIDSATIQKVKKNGWPVPRPAGMDELPTDASFENLFLK